MNSEFHPFSNHRPMENRFRYRKIRVRQSRARIFLQFEKDENSSFSSLSTLSTGKASVSEQKRMLFLLQVDAEDTGKRFKAPLEGSCRPSAG